jgi:hypothetical protein
MHTAALFKQQTCQLAHGRRTQFHGVCIWASAARILPVTFHRGHVVTSSSGTTLTIARLHVCIFFRNGSGFPVWVPVVKHSTFCFFMLYFFFGTLQVFKHRPLQVQEQPVRNHHNTRARRLCTGHIAGLQCWTFTFEYYRLYPAAMTDKEHIVIVVVRPARRQWRF